MSVLHLCSRLCCELASLGSSNEGWREETRRRAAMIIPVHTHGEKLKYMLIELQGTLRSADQDTLDGQSVGTISVREVRAQNPQGCKAVARTLRPC